MKWSLATTCPLPPTCVYSEINDRAGDRLPLNAFTTLFIQLYFFPKYYAKSRLFSLLVSTCVCGLP